MATPKAGDSAEALEHQSERLDEALEETFPASDPSPVSPGPGPVSDDSGSIAVRDNPERQRFEMVVDGRGGRQMAVAEYRLSPGVITFFHTEVPPALEGKGVGSRLIESALKQARARGLKVVSRCSFVSHFLREHPEFGDLQH